MIIRSNSIILACDASPAFVPSGNFSPFKKDLYPLSFIQNLSFDVANVRSRMKQISSADFAFDAVQFSPIISVNFDFISSTAFLNENFLGLYFKPSSNFASIFQKINDFSHNLYFLLSDDYPNDLIYKIQKNGNLNGLTSWSFGNCFIKNYSLNLSAGSLPTTSITIDAMNMQMNTVANNIINCPAINLGSGNQSGIANVQINNTNFISNLNNLNTSATGQPILPTFDAKFFTLSNDNIQYPSIEISPYNKSVVTSLNLSIDIERENSYGFGSDYIYDNRIKFPLLGTLDVEATAFGLNTGDGSLSGAMSKESGYRVEFSTSDSVNTKTTVISGARLQNNSYSIDYSSNLTSKFSFSFQCNRNQGIMHKWTQNINPSSGQLFTEDIFGLLSSDGNGFKSSDDYYFQY